MVLTVKLSLIEFSIIYFTGYYRAEEIPDEERTLGANDTLVQVAHFHKEARSTFGVPFFIKVQIYLKNIQFYDQS